MVEKALKLISFPGSQPLADLNLLGKLRITDQYRRKDQDMRGTYRRILIREVLEADESERKEQGISVVAPVPLDNQGHMVISPSLIYPVFVLFPGSGGRIMFLSSLRLSIADTFCPELPIPAEASLSRVDLLVQANATLRRENIFEYYDRCINEIKYLDSLIKQCKLHETSAEKLNVMKHHGILKYLQAGQDLERMFPCLIPTWHLSQRRSQDNVHMTLEMMQPRSPFFINELTDPLCGHTLGPTANFKTSNINTEVLQRRNGSYQRGYYSETNKLAHALMAFFSKPLPL